MKGSEKTEGMISVMINICTRVVTLIFIIVSFFANFFRTNGGEISWSLMDIWGVLLIGIISGLAFGIFYIKKNMTNAQMITLKICYFLILNAVLCFVGFSLGWFKKEASSIAVMEIMFILVYFLVTLLVYLLDFKEAKKINEKLRARKKSVHEMQ